MNFLLFLHHGAIPAPRHNDGFAAQLRIVPLLHGRIKRVHVDVNDFASGHLEHHLSLVFGASASAPGYKEARGHPRRCHRAVVRAIDGIRNQGSLGSLSFALSFNWFTEQSPRATSSRILPKYFAWMSFPSVPGWQ